MNTDSSELTRRKAKHIEVCTDPTYDPEGGSALFEHLSFRHKALPEMGWSELKTEIEFLGRTVKLPLFISSMTGGSESSYALNKDLARAAQAVGVPVGMGSIRILFRKPESFADFHLRPLAPDVPIFSNLGAQQLVEERLRDHYKTLHEWNKRLEVDAQVIHLNPGQELYQDDGDRDFRGLKDTLEEFIARSPRPVIVKETGFGIAPDEVDWLLKAGAAYVDLAGSGGTNWLTVEAYRLDEAGYESGEALRDWGWPTALLMAAVGHRKGWIWPRLSLSGRRRAASPSQRSEPPRRGARTRSSPCSEVTSGPSRRPCSSPVAGRWPTCARHRSTRRATLTIASSGSRRPESWKSPTHLFESGRLRRDAIGGVAPPMPRRAKPGSSTARLPTLSWPTFSWKTPSAGCPFPLASPRVWS